jgi:hypothetical protein
VQHLAAGAHQLLMVSIMWTGMRMVRAWSASSVIACRIPAHVA